MLYNDIIIEILRQNKDLKVPPSQTDIAKILGMTRQAICGRAGDKTDFNSDDVAKIFDFYNVNLQMLDTPEHSKVIANIIQGNNESSCPYRLEHNCPCKEQFEIHYIDELPEEAKLPEITSLHVDMELVVNHWQRKPENLRIIPMQGDNLSSYFYPCKNRDILIVDVESTIATREGLYVYSAHNNTMLFVGKLWQGMDGTIKIERFEATGEVTEKFITPEKQKEVDFRILARVVKNASLSL